MKYILSSFSPTFSLSYACKAARYEKTKHCFSMHNIHVYVYGIETIRCFCIVDSCQRLCNTLCNSLLTIMRTVKCAVLSGSFSMTNLVLKLQPWRSSRRKVRTTCENLVRSPGESWESHWSCSLSRDPLECILHLRSTFPHCIPFLSASPWSSRHPPVPPLLNREVHTVAFETSREGTLTSIFRIELRSFHVPNSWWDCTGAKEDIAYKIRVAY